MEDMVKDPNCAYCMQGELVAKFGYPVCEMKTGFLYVFKEQSKKGRVILAHKKHVSELIDLTDEERNDYFAEVAQAARAVGVPAGQGKLRCLRRHRTSPALSHCPQV